MKLPNCDRALLQAKANIVRGPRRVHLLGLLVLSCQTRPYARNSVLHGGFPIAASERMSACFATEGPGTYSAPVTSWVTLRQLLSCCTAICLVCAAFFAIEALETACMRC